MGIWKSNDDGLQSRHAIHRFIELVIFLAVIALVGGALYAYTFNILDLSRIQRVLLAPSGAVSPDILQVCCLCP